MDLTSGFWQVAMSPDASRKAVFVTHGRLFQFRVMPFSLCNAPAMFERLMDRVLSGMRWSHCWVYLDDVISFDTDTPEAMLQLTELLERLSSFGLQLKAKKCMFMQIEVDFLGHVAIRQFVGFVGYYRRFIPNYASLSEPLVALTPKGTVFVWTTEKQAVFDASKSCLLRAPILDFPTESDRFVLDTDASLLAVGGVLNQIGSGGSRSVAIVMACWPNGISF